MWYPLRSHPLTGTSTGTRVKFLGIKEGPKDGTGERRTRHLPPLRPPPSQLKDLSLDTGSDPGRYRHPIRPVLPSQQPPLTGRVEVSLPRYDGPRPLESSPSRALPPHRDLQQSDRSLPVLRQDRPRQPLPPAHRTFSDETYDVSSRRPTKSVRDLVKALSRKPG